MLLCSWSIFWSTVFCPDPTITLGRSEWVSECVRTRVYVCVWWGEVVLTFSRHHRLLLVTFQTYYRCCTCHRERGDRSTWCLADQGKVFSLEFGKLGNSSHKMMKTTVPLLPLSCTSPGKSTFTCLFSLLSLRNIIMMLFFKIVFKTKGCWHTHLYHKSLLTIGRDSFIKL